MPRRKGDAFTYFAMILYPENETHKRVLDLIQNNRVQFPEYLYILHDKDEVEEDEIDTLTSGLEEQEVHDLKKAHWHVMFKYCMSRSEESILRLWNGTVSKVIGISDYVDQGLYFTHESPRALLQGKHIYPKSELHGTKFFMSKIDSVQNSYFVQFLNAVDGIAETPHCSMYEYVHELAKLPDDERNFALSILHTESQNIKQCAIDIRNIRHGIYWNYKEENLL